MSDFTALIDQMTLQEKIAQLDYLAPAIDRLNLPRWRWGSEYLHAAGRVGRSTCFPTALNLAQTWNQTMIRNVGQSVGQEVRAKFHHAIKDNWPGFPIALMGWSPTLNLFRDPRWGRGQETYGEDPLMISRMGRAYIQGQAGDHQYLQVGAIIKHYAAYSGPAEVRCCVDNQVDERELWRTYLPHFAACFTERGTVGVMAAYNAVNGHPCSCHPHLLGKILRDEMGFDGIVVSDGYALHHLHESYQITKNSVESAALAFNRGCQVCLGDRTFYDLDKAVEQGMVSEWQIDQALRKLFEVRERFGVFADAGDCPWDDTSQAQINSPEHAAVSLQAAQQSIVLLKNDGILPLNPRNHERVLLTGPHGADVRALLGGHYGCSPHVVSILEGVTAALHQATLIDFWPGCDVASMDRQMIEYTCYQATRGDLIIAVLGMNPFSEAEANDGPLADCCGDRDTLNLQGVQGELLEGLIDTGKPIVLVLTGCAPQSIGQYLDRVAACIHIGYPGDQGGTAVADVLFGKCNPSGRLAVTWPQSVDDLPDFMDYSMLDRTYRFSRRTPLFPFGFGLSYTQFSYDCFQVPPQVECGQPICIQVSVTNSGDMDGSEVVELYVERPDAPLDHPQRLLADFTRVTIPVGQTVNVELIVPPTITAMWDEHGYPVISPGSLHLSVGGSQGDSRSFELGAAPSLHAQVEMVGNQITLPRGPIDLVTVNC